MFNMPVRVGGEGLEAAPASGINCLYSIRVQGMVDRPISDNFYY